MNIFIKICIVVAISGVLFLAEICCSRHVAKKDGSEAGGGLIILFLGISNFIIGVLSCLLLSANGYLPQLPL